MSEGGSGANSVEKLINDIKIFIKLTLSEDEISLEKWASEVADEIESFCFKKMGCNRSDCLAYDSDCGRCWLQVGTLCGGKVQGKFADKVELCTECAVYQEYVGDDLIRNLRELVFTLVHSVNLRKQELTKALTEVKTLRGLIPICSSCKMIRDDKGAWNRIESYLAEHSEAEFTHSYCHSCIRKLYPEIADAVIGPLESPTD
jgi:hypothetical protein